MQSPFSAVERVVEAEDTDEADHSQDMDTVVVNGKDQDVAAEAGGSYQQEGRGGSDRPDARGPERESDTLQTEKSF
jgi:hypothetical protein